METTHHKKVLQKGRFKFPLIKTSGTYLNTTSSLGTSKRLSMGEEVGTMQSRVLGEIKDERWRYA
jgi:hypothetical protein